MGRIQRRDLVGAIAHALDVIPSIAYAPPREGDIRVSCGDPSAARAALGFTARTSLAEGLLRTLPTSSRTGSAVGRIVTDMRKGRHSDVRAVA